ncbi:MAG: hypothetical protein AB7S49_04140 [Arcobacter sp.]|uniref:hypothetical protein n=1 Tax=Arcobacter sp. TaxID=1872629 RepID=UPI003CFD101C
MSGRKIVISLVTLSLLSSSLYAKKDENILQEPLKGKYKDYIEPNVKEHKNNIKEKSKKEYKNYKDYEEEKFLPKGLEKKVQKDGTLPSGWQKKLAKGQIADDRILRSGTMINSKNYPFVKNSDIYRVEDKVFRVAQGTNMIMEIFK